MRRWRSPQRSCSTPLSEFNRTLGSLQTFLQKITSGSTQRGQYWETERDVPTEAKATSPRALRWEGGKDLLIEPSTRRRRWLFWSWSMFHSPLPFPLHVLCQCLLIQSLFFLLVSSQAKQEGSGSFSCTLYLLLIFCKNFKLLLFWKPVAAPPYTVLETSSVLTLSQSQGTIWPEGI